MVPCPKTLCEHRLMINQDGEAGSERGGFLEEPCEEGRSGGEDI